MDRHSHLLLNALNVDNPLNRHIRSTPHSVNIKVFKFGTFISKSIKASKSEGIEQ